MIPSTTSMMITRMAINPKIVANITTNERSLNLIKLMTPQTKAAIPAIIAHIPTMRIGGVPGAILTRFLPRISAIKNTRKTANEPPAHFPSFVFGIIFLPYSAAKRFFASMTSGRPGSASFQRSRNFRYCSEAFAFRPFCSYSLANLK
jgi:hypothetical protein